MSRGFVIILKAVMALLFIITFAYVVISLLGLKEIGEWRYSTPWEDREPPKLYEAKAFPNPLDAGEEMTITARVSDNSGIDCVKAKIQKPDENNIAVIELFDDGLHSDGKKRDFIYGNTWKATESGKYYVDIEICDIKSNCIEYENI